MVYAYTMTGNYMQVLAEQIYNEQNIVIIACQTRTDPTGDVSTAESSRRRPRQSRKTVPSRPTAKR